MMDFSVLRLVRLYRRHFAVPAAICGDTGLN
jgi:hypothetical protein